MLGVLLCCLCPGGTPIKIPPEALELASAPIRAGIPGLPMVNALSNSSELPPLAPIHRPVQVPCRLKLPPPEHKTSRSRHVDLRRFAVLDHSTVCEKVREEGGSVDLLRISFVILEAPAAEAASGFRLLLTDKGKGREVSAGWVESLDISHSQHALRERRYQASAIVPSSGVYSLELTYRLEVTRFWETQEGLDALGVVADKRNKKDAGWMLRVPPHTLRTMMSHETKVYAEPIILELDGGVRIDRKELPWCYEVPKISTIGRIRPLQQVAFSYDVAWEPSNCRMRERDREMKTFRDFLAAIPGDVKVRLLGDSNMEFFTRYTLAMQRTVRNSLVRNEGKDEGPYKVVPNNFTMKWRFFRGAVCGDRITPAIFTKLCNDSMQRRCERVFAPEGAELKKSEASEGRYNTYFMNAGWWAELKKSEASEGRYNTYFMNAGWW
eukprot:Hpha_TRINITY_DN14625_c0_g1::TRINITY_DN14625_c0_g1_i2::g.48250::m.48250